MVLAASRAAGAADAAKLASGRVSGLSGERTHAAARALACRRKRIEATTRSCLYVVRQRHRRDEAEQPLQGKRARAADQSPLPDVARARAPARGEHAWAERQSPRARAAALGEHAHRVSHRCLGMCTRRCSRRARAQGQSPLPRHVHALLLSASTQIGRAHV